jgi:hypothetical protein
MNIDGIIESAEFVLQQSYREFRSQYDGLLVIIEAYLKSPLVPPGTLKSLERLRAQLLLRREAEALSFPGATASR